MRFLSISRLQIGPIFRALSRHKYTALMVIIQMAVTMAIVTNGVFIAAERYQHIQRHSGMDEENSFYLTSSGFTDSFNPRASIEQDLATLRSMPGIINAVQTNSFPLSDGGEWFNLQRNVGENQQTVQAAQYKFDHHGIETFDLTLIAGQNFSSEEVLWQDESTSSWPSQVILSKATAQALFGDQQWQKAVGKTIYVEDAAAVIVKGVIDKLQAPWVEWENVDNVIISPARVNYNSARYVILAEPGRRDAMMQDVETTLASSNRQRLIRRMGSIESIKREIYAADIAAVSILMITVAVLSGVSAMGIAGLASFNINKRKRQIGARRALGASRGDILAYFMLENLLLTTVGVCLGSLLAVGLNLFLVNMYGITPLAWPYVPVAILTLIIIGQVAVFWPARKASAISPALATKAI